MLASLILVSGIAAAAAAKPFEYLVTFGDSYTDNGRLSYYQNNGNKAPPAGTYHTVTNKTASGGLAWGQYIEQSTGARYLDYAVSGATCSQSVVKRTYPAVLDDEIPSFKADTAFTSLYPVNRTADNTVYALWIGTNDLGTAGFVLDGQVGNSTITDYINCVWTVFDNIYSTGGRRFVLLNLAPLEKSPLYATIEKGGTGDSMFWPNKTAYDVPELSKKMYQYTTTVNTAFEYGIPFELFIKKRWPGANFTLFDVHSLMNDMIAMPSKYFDAPANVTGYWHHCKPTNGSDCANQTQIGPLSAFLWYDELHPSDKADSIIAKNFIDVVAGNSSYGTYY